MATEAELRSLLEQVFAGSKSHTARLTYNSNFETVRESVSTLKMLVDIGALLGWQAVTVKPFLNKLVVKFERGDRCAWQDRNGRCRKPVRNGAHCHLHASLVQRRAATPADRRTAAVEQTNEFEEEKRRAEWPGDRT